MARPVFMASGHFSLTQSGETPPPAPVINYDLAYAYVSPETSGIGPDVELTGIENDGSGGWDYSSGGSGDAVQKTGTGFSFSNGQFMASPTVDPDTTGGAFAVAEFTPASQGGASALIIEGTPSTYMALRISSGNIQFGYHTGGSASWVNLGPAQYGVRTVVGIEIDDDAKTVRAYLSGQEVQIITDRTFDDRSFTVTRLGAGLDGTLHRACLVTRVEGQPWPLDFIEVLEDFTGGL